jgi:glycosyltransferase involved in cell wall biosynthesis
MTTDAVGGVWTYSLELIRQLENKGVDITLATMGPLPTDEQLRELESSAHVRLYMSDYDLEWTEDPWLDVEQAGIWLKEIEKKDHPDLVHLNGYVHASLDWTVPCLVVGHSCVLSWWQAVKGEEAPEHLDRYRSEVRNGLRSADMVIAPSATMLNALESNYGPFEASRVVFNGRDSRMFLPAEKKPFVFTAGRAWDEAKNIATVERAAHNIRWPVYIAGGDSQAGNKENVHHLGRLGPHEMAEYYDSASIYVLPARYEPFGLSALEAALAGCALVLGDIPSLREIWGESALFVSPDDENGIIEAVNSLIADHSSMMEMSHRAITTALRYTTERMVNDYLSAVLCILPRFVTLGMEEKICES